MKYQSLLIFALSLTAVACGGGSKATATAPIASPAVAPIAKEDSCIELGALLECALEHQGVERTFKIYAPSSLDETAAVQVLFNFHGYGSSADEQLLYGDFRDLSEQEGFLLVIPQGSLLDGDTHWNSDSDLESKSSADDSGFVSKIIDAISERYDVEPSGVYAVGMSNGGAMSLYLACSLSQRITAVASVTGFMSANLLSDCGVTTPTSVLFIHGTADKVVSWDNGLGGGPILSLAAFWASHNRCSDSSTERLEDYNGDGVSGVLHKYSACSAGTQVQVYEITDMGHVWPEKRRGDDINGAEVVWTFLTRFQG